MTKHTHRPLGAAALAAALLLAGCATGPTYRTNPNTGEEVAKILLNFHAAFPTEVCLNQDGEDRPIKHCADAGFDLKYTWPCDSADPTPHERLTCLPKEAGSGAAR